MRYWIFQNNQVNGPFEPDDLAQVSGFSAEALVCSEGRRGTNMGDWQRAGMVPELSVALLKATQLANVPVGAGGGIYGTLPPEPTLKDLAALGSLQEKINVLEGVLSQMQDALRTKDSELLALHRELEEKKLREGELASKLGGLEERLSHVQKMRANLDEAIAAEKAVESTVSDVERSVKDVESSLKDMEAVADRQKETIDRLMQELNDLKEARVKDSETLEEIKNRPSGAGPAAHAMPSPAVPAFDAPPPGLKSLDEIKPLDAAPVKPLSEVKPFGAEPVIDLDAPPMPMPVTAPPPMSLDVTAPPPAEPTKQMFTEPPIPMTPAAEAPKADLKPADAPPPPPVVESAAPAAAAPAARGKKGPIIAAVAAVLALGGGYVFMNSGGKAPAPVEEPAPAPVDAPPPAPEPSLAEQQNEELKQQAIGLVRMWPSGDPMASVGQRLEALPPSATQASPWFAEKLADGLFQVNYYAAAPGGQTIYQFQVRPMEKQVAPMNVAAKELLEPKPVVKAPEPPKEPAKPKRKVRVRPKQQPVEDSGLLDNPLDSALDGSAPPPAAKPRPARKQAAKKAADEETLDNLLAPGAEERAAQPQQAEQAPKPRAQKPVPQATEEKEPSDAELLDELLKP